MPESLEGSLKTITYQNAENGFSVLKFEVTGEKRPVAVTGTFPALSVGEALRMEGFWKVHPKYGRQFVCTKSETVKPETGEGIVAYLSGGLFKGVGRATAQRMVDTFGTKLFEVLDNGGEELKSKRIRGISGKKLSQFLDSWKSLHESRETMMFLYEHGIAGGVALRLWRQYSTETVRILSENPYILCEDVWGIGFVKADEIARKVGIPETSESRLEAGICYAISKASGSEGHTYLPRDVLLTNAAKELRLTFELPEDSDNLIYALDSLIKSKKLREDTGKIAIPQLERAESFVADFVQERIQNPDVQKTLDGPDPEPAGNRQELESVLADFEKERGITFAPEQREGILQAFRSRLFIITGGPGTGKTTMLQGILALAESREDDVTLAAPTGRAAKRMQDVTGHDARTLHRLLEINPETKRFMRNKDFPLETSLVIVDEFSMVDTWLAAGLFQAIQPHSRIVLIGDKDQLPSIGPGNVLRDLLSIPQMPSIRLNRIFRQAGGNDIAEKASQINQGQKPSPIEGNNFHYIPFEDPDEAFGLLADLVTHKIPELLGDAAKNVQILSPMRKGPLGIIELNAFLQKLLNEAPTGFLYNGIAWKMGDRVMQLRNNYEKNVFNGDIGRIIAILKNDQKITVDFDGHLAGFEGDELEEMNLAYACTIHKSQGSEYPAVILVLDSSHYRMLQRNLLYTGITRAKGHVWILSGNGAFDEAIRNNRTVKRYTRLNEMIAGEMPSKAEGTKNPYGKFMDFLEDPL